MNRIFWIVFLLMLGLMVYRNIFYKPKGDPEVLSLSDSTGWTWAHIKADTPGWSKQLTITYEPSPTPVPEKEYTNAILH